MIDREEVNVDALVADLRRFLANVPPYISGEEARQMAEQVIDALETLSLDLDTAKWRNDKLREERGSEVTIDWPAVAKKRATLVQALSDCEPQSPEWWYFSGLMQGFDWFRRQVAG